MGEIYKQRYNDSSNKKKKMNYDMYLWNTFIFGVVTRYTQVMSLVIWDNCHNFWKTSYSSRLNKYNSLEIWSYI
jgi:hypothetical protein